MQNLDTPCLILDEARMMRNIERLQARAANLGVALRPHLKTAKSIDVARWPAVRCRGTAAPLSQP